MGFWGLVNPIEAPPFLVPFSGLPFLTLYRFLEKKFRFKDFWKILRFFVLLGPETLHLKHWLLCNHWIQSDMDSYSQFLQCLTTHQKLLAEISQDRSYSVVCCKSQICKTKLPHKINFQTTKAEHSCQCTINKHLLIF